MTQGHVHVVATHHDDADSRHIWDENCPDCLARDSLITELVGALEKVVSEVDLPVDHPRFSEWTAKLLWIARTALSHAREEGGHS